jgi:hypothetical protein
MNNSPQISPRAGKLNLFIILIVFLGIGLILFGGLSIYAFGKANTATSTLEKQKSVAVSDAIKKQQAADYLSNLKSNESPYRTYTAPVDYGSFQITFPKNWSAYDQESVQSQTQVVLSLNPDFVYQTNGQFNPAAVRVTLTQQLTTTVLSAFKDQLRTNKMKQQDITVSGLKGYDLTGAFPDKKTIRAIYIPIRDKTMIISTEDKNYADEYNQILAQAVINP